MTAFSLFGTVAYAAGDHTWNPTIQFELHPEGAFDPRRGIHSVWRGFVQFEPGVERAVDFWPSAEPANTR